MTACSSAASGGRLRVGTGEIPGYVLCRCCVCHFRPGTYYAALCAAAAYDDGGVLTLLAVL